MRSIEECAEYMIKKYGKKAVDIINEYVVENKYNGNNNAYQYWSSVLMEIKNKHI